jgi:hypothetical protein
MQPRELFKNDSVQMATSEKKKSSTNILDESELIFEKCRNLLRVEKQNLRQEFTALLTDSLQEFRGIADHICSKFDEQSLEVLKIVKNNESEITRLKNQFKTTQHPTAQFSPNESLSGTPSTPKTRTQRKTLEKKLKNELYASSDYLPTPKPTPPVQPFTPKVAQSIANDLDNMREFFDSQDKNAFKLKDQIFEFQEKFRKFEFDAVQKNSELTSRVGDLAKKYENLVNLQYNFNGRIEINAGKLASLGVAAKNLSKDLGELEMSVMENIPKLDNKIVLMGSESSVGLTKANKKIKKLGSELVDFKNFFIDWEQGLKKTLQKEKKLSGNAKKDPLTEDAIDKKIQTY